MDLQTAITIGALLLAVVGFLYNRRDKRDSDHGSQANKEASNAAAIAILTAKVSRLEDDYKSLRTFNDEHLPRMLDEIKSDAFGTIANNNHAVEKRLDRIERVLNGKLREP